MRWLTLYILMCAPSLMGQNLIPDGEVNTPEILGCNRFEDIAFTEFWYVAGGTPDLYQGNCEYTINSVFFGVEPPAAYLNPDGLFGMWYVCKDDFSVGTEVLATQLLAPLETGSLYYFALEARARGVYHPAANIDGVFCPIDPVITLDVYTNTARITSVEDDRGAAIDVLADQVLSLRSMSFEDAAPTFDWTRSAGCFVAPNNATDLAIGFSNRPFDPVAPCVSANAVDDWFGLVYSNVDDFELRKIPSQIRDTVLLCAEQQTVSFDFSPYFEDIDLELLTPNWTDDEGYIKTFDQSGLYRFELLFDCGAAEFEVFVADAICEVRSFVPNAFSPNGNGINDLFIPFIKSDFPVGNFQFTIFDRWGGKVFKSVHPTQIQGWDGTVDGQPAQQGAYTWLLEFDHFKTEGTEAVREFGDVTLVR